ncbi:MAG: RloB family protein [Clostridiaceae bacterium]|nr:RloB family protein [Clostridiaceae bacterium]
MNRRFGDKPRGTGSRKRKPVMFLSLEGNNKTEKLYLQSLNKDLGEKYALIFSSSRVTDLPNMWTALHDLMRGSFSSEDGDKAYCLCDRDYEPHKLERLKVIKQESRRSQAKLIVSNPCFEIWILNHFRYSTKSYPTGRELMGDLCSFVPCYEKNRDYYTVHLKSKTLDAIRNSIRQIEQISGDSPPDSFIPENPGTEVYEIVQAIHV